jgi:exopolysaccharide biosynthesis protein
MAAFFDIDQNSRMTPSGFLVFNKRILVKPSSKRRGGSGVIYQRTGGEFEIAFVDNFVFDDTIVAALQVGPLVVDPGGKNGIRRNDFDRQDRTAICRGPNREIIVVVVKGGLSLHEMGELLSARSFDGGFECDRALNLDGGPSTAVSFSAGNTSIELEGRWKIPDALIVKNCECESKQNQPSTQR